MLSFESSCSYKALNCSTLLFRKNISQYIFKASYNIPFIFINRIIKFEFIFWWNVIFYTIRLHYFKLYLKRICYIFKESLKLLIKLKRKKAFQIIFIYFDIQRKCFWFEIIWSTFRKNKLTELKCILYSVFRKLSKRFFTIFRA